MMKPIAALAILATVASAYPGDAPTSCGGYTCPKGWVPQLDNGMTVCDGPCLPSDCCDRLPTKTQPPVYSPAPPAYNPPTPAPAKKCVPLRTGDGNKCVIKTGFDNKLGEASLGVGSCTDSRVLTFCDCDLQTADNKCLTSTQNTGRDGASLVLRDCGKCSSKGTDWQYLSNGKDFYMKNGFNKYINYDGKTLIQSNKPGFFYLERPCVARLENSVVTPAPAPVSPTPQVPTTCGALQCPYGWNKVLDAGMTVCNGPCKVTDCCERGAPIEPIRSCGAYTCPKGWMPKDPVDAGITMCVLDLVNGCLPQECCVRKY